MKISFYSNRMQFDGDVLETRGVGGSEAALVNLSTCWKKQFPQDEITIYNGNQRRSKVDYNGIIYKNIIDFKLECRNFDLDAFISLRETIPLEEPYLDSKCIIFWSEDDSNEQSIQNIKNNLYFQNRIDLLLAVSEYAKNDIEKYLNVPTKLFRNGYRQDWIDDCVKEPYLCVYTSTPFRGLDILSEVWDTIYEKCNLLGIKPKLKIFTGMGLYNQPDDPFIQLYEKLRSQIGVEICPPICQKDLYKELSKCSVMLYSNHYTETSCMSVLESLANRLWVITSDLGALGEQVKDGTNGYLIKGDAYSEEYKNEFIEKSVRAISGGDFFPNSSGLIFSWQEQSLLMRQYVLQQLECRTEEKYE